MIRLSPRSIVLAAGLAVAAPVAGQQDPPEKLPITAITLYRSGVGSFERRALVENDAAIQLRFKTEQINDILKSMVLLDLNGGRIDTVSYGSKEPLERRLASFGVDISDDPAAGELLARLRGTPVRLTTPEGEVSGTIMNVETRPTIVGGGPNTPPTKHDLPWMNLITPTGVRSVNLTDVTGFQILDSALAEELNKALAALAEHRADRVKTVDLTLRGEGARQIVVAYVHEMPVWKTSYRLVLPDQPEAREGQKQTEGGLPTIQGWAIVENTTDEDWNDVKLALVAGRPVSFQMDLYEPLHVYRPEVPVPMVAGVLPKVYQEGTPAYDAVAQMDLQSVLKSEARLRSAAEPPTPSAPPARGGGGRSPFRDDNQDQAPLTGDDIARYAAAAQAQAGEIGEVFQYQLKNPVTIERQRSAMLPILASAINGRRVSIYNRGDSGDHPMRGVSLKNDTGLQLMPGPVSVFDGPAYAGDAQIGHVSVGDSRLIAYAVDLDVAATVKDDSTATVQKIRIVGGLIEQTTKRENRVGYGFTNKDAKRGRTILIEHPKVQGWTLVEPAKPSEETSDLYRFELEAKPSETKAVAVKQERVERQSLQVVGYDLKALLGYSKDGKASAKVVEAVQHAAELQTKINEIERRIGELDRESTAINTDQSRIRQNMQTVERTTDLYKRYMTKLGEQETRLEQLTTERAKATEGQTGAQAELEAYLRGLNVD